MIKEKDLKDIWGGVIKLNKMKNLMTPKSLLSKEEFERPHVITPEEFPSFESLLEFKEDIRNLKLVPVKDDHMHTFYNLTDKKDLIKEVNSYLLDSDIAYTPNRYPYWLSPDVQQSLVWIKDGIMELEIYVFLSKLMSHFNLTYSDIIVFERPINTKSVLIKGTFPNVRHIHIWTKNKNHGT